MSEDRFKRIQTGNNNRPVQDVITAIRGLGAQRSEIGDILGDQSPNRKPSNDAHQPDGLRECKGVSLNPDDFVNDEDEEETGA